MKEPSPVGMLHPWKPQSNPAKKQKNIDAYITHTAKTEKRIPARKLHMKEDDKEHGGSH